MLNMRQNLKKIKNLLRVLWQEVIHVGGKFLKSCHLVKFKIVRFGQYWVMPQFANWVDLQCRDGSSCHGHRRSCKLLYRSRCSCYKRFWSNEDFGLPCRMKEHSTLISWSETLRMLLIHNWDIQAFLSARISSSRYLHRTSCRSPLSYGR